MRTTLSLFAVLALAACGGGGGGTTPSAPSQPVGPPATMSPQNGYVTPQFTLRIPARGTSTARAPKYVSSGTLSVVITLTADSAGIDPTTITGNPATTSIPAGSCASGCTVNGPPTPPGTDSFTVVTYDNATPASGHALNAGQKNGVTITAGQSNAVTITLGAIPATLTVGTPATKNAGTQGQTQTLTVTAQDAAGVTIPTGSSIAYVDATGAAASVTVSDPDTASHGSCVRTGGSASACTSGVATSASLSGPDAVANLDYDGLAEAPVTITASATGATSGSATFQPTLSAPAFNASHGTPAGVAQSGAAEIDLFAPSGVGSTGTQYFTEAGWTGSPYGHALTVAAGGSCSSGTGLATALSQIATMSAGTNDTTLGTPIVATVVASPTAGSCPAKVSDGLTGNSTDGSASLTVTYTSSSLSGSAKIRK